MAEDESPPTRGGKGNFLTRKVGPIPMWGWIAAVAVGVGIFIYRKKAAASAQTAAASGATGTATTAPDVFGASGYAGGQQTGGYDSSSSDSFLQSLQSQLANIQGGVQLNPTGQGQLTSAISTTPSPVAVPNPSNAPVTASNPIDAYISAQYEQTLNRAPDAGGLAYWRSVYLSQGPTAEAQQFTTSAQKELHH